VVQNRQAAAPAGPAAANRIDPYGADPRTRGAAAPAHPEVSRERSRVMKTTCTAAIALAAFATAASAQINPVGPFTGEETEIYDGSGNDHLCIPGGIFNNRAEHCADRLWFSSSWGFDCTIRTQFGGVMITNRLGHHNIEFRDPVTRFGGYFGTNVPERPPHLGDEAIFEFYDAAGFVGEERVSLLPKCDWHWGGWEFSTPITRIVVRSNWEDGIRLFFDILEADFGAVPCYPDCDNNGVLDFFDFLCFQNAFLAQDPYADCDQNNVFDFFDFLCFQNEFLAGC
jgi:hypothetical protein